MNLRKSVFVTFAATCALLAPASAKRPAPAATPAVQPAAAPTQARPALWKIADADTTIYLFGTIHLLPPGIEWYEGKLATAFESSKELVTEIPDVPEGEALAVMLKHGTLPAGQSLRDGMTAEERLKYEAAMNGIGLPPAAFDRHQPWFAAVVLATMPLQKAGYSMDNGIEAQLDKRNKALGRPRIGLETLDFQLGIFAGFSPQVQKTYLFSVIDAMPTLPQEIGKMVTAWSKGDVDALAAMLNAETDDPALYDALLTKRNANWAGWIDDRLDQPGIVFMAVGAGHLGGKDSVQTMLHKKGIKAVRVQ
ncbi:MAG: TraB/GumN family protein [Sphingomonadales bacterium]|nr:TraB/GumN family protein [Sphingomonadales bacterium]